jgi:Peptidase family M41
MQRDTRASRAPAKKPKRRLLPRRPARVERTAYHEAGHAVAAYLRHLRFTSISIIPYRGTLGRCEFSEAGVILDLDLRAMSRTRRRIETLIVVSLGGVIAECLLSGRNNWRGAHADLHDAARYASVVTGSEDEMGAYVRWLWEHTRMLLSAPPCWLAVQRLASALLDDHRIGERRARRIIAEALKQGAPKPRGRRKRACA